MTPAQILAEAKSRFMVLYLEDPDILNRLLRQALGKFQDKAGVIVETWLEEAVSPLPPLFHGVAGCCDAKRRYIAYRYGEIEENGKKIKTIVLVTNKRHEKPYCLSYFCDLRNWDVERELPGDCDALITDYLEALIAVQNTKRERESYLMAGMNDPAQNLLSEQELRQRVTDLEREMEDNKAMILPASMF